MKIEESQIPEGWEWVTAEDACGSVRDGTHDTPKYVDDGIPLVTSKNLIDGRVCFEKAKFISPEDHEEISRRSGVENGDVLFAMIGTIGNPVVVNTSNVFSIKNVALFKNNEDNILPKYLKYWLESPGFDSWLKPRLRGSTQKFASLGLLRSLPIPYAPLPQQKSIVAEIEKQFSRLDEAVANLKRVKANLKRYKASVLKAAVEGKLTEEWRKQHPDVEPADKLLERILEERRENWQGRGKYKEPVTPNTTGLPELPEGWGCASADQLTSLITDGEHITPKRSDDGVLLLSARNVLNGKLSLAKVDHIPIDEYERLLKRLEVKAGDVLLSCSGTVGRSCVAPENLKFSLVRSVAVLRPIEVLPEFFCLQIQSCFIQMQIEEKKTQTAQANIFQGKIKTLAFMLPPISEQQEIASQLDCHLTNINVAEAQIDINLRHAGRLRQSILKKAFSGTI